MGVAVLSDLADLRRSFARLIGISLDDNFDQYDSEAQETIHHYIQHGLWNAQYWYLTNTPYKGWATSAALTISSAGADGRRTAALPSDFLKLDGRERRSAIRRADGTRWGTLVEPEELEGAYGNFYTLIDDNIVIAKNATVYSDLTLDYHYYHDELTEDGVTLTFPKLDRVLIPAEAAVLAMNDGWFPIESESEKQGIMTTLAHRRSVAASRARRSNQPTRLSHPMSAYGPGRFW